MTSTRCRYSLCLAVTVCLWSQPDAVKAQRGPSGRILSIDVTGAQVELYDPVVVARYFFGVQSVQLMLDWNAIEVAPGVYSAAYLKSINDYYAAQGLLLNLTLRPVDAGHKNVPSDLIDTAFDDPQMIFRFFRLLDYVFSQIPDVVLTSLGIGNEIDEYLRYHPSELTAYKRFYDWSLYYAKQLRPGLKVGVSANLGALTGSRYPELRLLNQYSDVLMVLYYPMNVEWSPVTGDITLFEVRDPSAVSWDIDLLTQLFPDKPMHFKEAGYPSSEICNSSEDKQREFITAMFNAWDVHSSQIELITFFRLTDFSPGETDYYAGYYSSQSNQFRSFLGSLGLRTWPATGRFKPAFAQLSVEARARGW